MQHSFVSINYGAASIFLKLSRDFIAWPNITNIAAAISKKSTEIVHSKIVCFGKGYKGYYCITNMS